MSESSEVAARYAVVAGGFGARVDGISGPQWSSATPCSDWTVRDLVAHVIMTQRRVVAALNGEEATDVDSDADLVTGWGQASATIVAALDDPARASTVVGAMFGDQSFASLVGRLVCTDTLIHTWDLARATGQDESLDPDAVARALDALTPMDDAIRRPGGFAPKAVPPVDADVQTRLLYFCGRPA